MMRHGILAKLRLQGCVPLGLRPEDPLGAAITEGVFLFLSRAENRSGYDEDQRLEQLPAF